jgi:hypothetical protein
VSDHPARSGRILLAVAAMLVVTAAVVLGGVWYMLTVFGDELEKELDSQVETVQRDFDRDTRALERDIERRFERALDERLPAVPGG